MVSPKRILDLTNYVTILPYSSEMFGIYQPLLGWKSKRIEERFQSGFQNDKSSILQKLQDEFVGIVDIEYNRDNSPTNIQIKPGLLETGKTRSFDSVFLHMVSLQLPPYEEYKDTIWQDIVTADLLDNVETEVEKAYKDKWIDVINPNEPNLTRVDIFERQLRFESSIDGAVRFLINQKNFDALKDIFYSTKDNTERALELIKMYSAENSTEAFLNIDNLDPQDIEHINSVALSPISVVHLFRQYFYEFDTFLGPPVKHVWLSPGATVELIEVQSRKTITEKTLATTLDILTKSETTTTQEDEISTAVKEDNEKDLKIGASVKASYGSIEASSSLDVSNSQKQSRESAHKHMRQQSEKISSEIRKNYSTTFKTVTEITDISSARHTLTNTTLDLINYELRRKMRQIGVQVQDIGTYLCWRTYVDDPGKDLGLSKLIHIAQPPELEDLPYPEAIPRLQPIKEEKMVTIPFISVDGSNADNEGEVYVDGIEVDDSEWFGSLEKIKCDFKQQFVCPQAGYALTNVEYDPQGAPIILSRPGTIENINGTAYFDLHLNSIDFQGQNSVQVKFLLHWSPDESLNQEIDAANKTKQTQFTEKIKAEYEKAYVESVKERVDKASKIITRNSEELREEERIVIYRKLIQEMLLNGVPVPDDRTRHVVSELINSIFDVEKMLYFVAPEWWRPRLHRSKQQLPQLPPPSPSQPNDRRSSIDKVLQNGLVRRADTAEANLTPDLMSRSTVGWGGINDFNRDNYFITESSEPAKLGSSLGWLLQLDGDNMRNAFLNAPWVKAVIPIRPGKEEAAINWLKGVEGMNGITDDVIYHTNNPNEVDINGNPYDGQRMIDVLVDLARKIKRKHEAGSESGEYPKKDEVSDPDLVDEENVVTATPIDRVYEHGFFPLQQSFRLNVGKDYEIFDQWLEILPTDQIVPVEVKYDPRTGRQVDETGGG